MTFTRPAWNLSAIDISRAFPRRARDTRRSHVARVHDTLARARYRDVSVSSF